MESGPGNIFWLKIEKTQKIHDFRPKKRGVIFLPPPPPQLPQKSGFQVRGVGGDALDNWGMCLLDKIMILQGVKLTIQPLGVGHANRPKKAQKGGYVAFSPTYAYLALIQQPLRGDFHVPLDSLSIWVLKYPYCHQMITQTHPRGNGRFS